MTDYQPARDDYLPLSDALRSLDSWPDHLGNPDSLVKGQHVFDLLFHRGVLGAGKNEITPERMVGADRTDKTDPSRSYTSRLWAEDWNSPEDAKYDEPHEEHR